jgi:hypothetical protein
MQDTWLRHWLPIARDGGGGNPRSAPTCGQAQPKVRAAAPATTELAAPTQWDSVSAMLVEIADALPAHPGPGRRARLDQTTLDM